MRRRDGINYLTDNGKGSNLRTPGSRYGQDSAECAEVAWRLAYLTARETGEPITQDDLDYAMSLVVNDDDDVVYTIRNYGNYKYR